MALPPGFPKALLSACICQCSAFSPAPHAGLQGASSPRTTAGRLLSSCNLVSVLKKQREHKFNGALERRGVRRGKYWKQRGKDSFVSSSWLLFHCSRLAFDISALTRGEWSSDETLATEQTQSLASGGCVCR